MRSRLLPEGYDEGDVLDRPWDDVPTGHPVSEDLHCGTACDICTRPMCAIDGPAPAATCLAHRECVDCHVDNACTDCAAERRREAAA